MNKNDNKVSIIIPCYNGEKYVYQCIASILKQTYDFIEIVFLNDGSTDQSKKKLFELEKEIENRGFELRYIEQKNMGLGATIEKGIFYATGEYLTLLDVDDILLEESVEERVIQFIKSPEISIARTNGYIVKDDLSTESAGMFVECKEDVIEENIFIDLVKGETFNWAGSYMVRTKEIQKFYQEVEFYKSRCGQNLQILMPLAYKRKSILINKPLMLYVKYDKTMSSGNTVEESIKLQREYCKIRETVIRQIVKNQVEVEKYISMAQISMAHRLLYISEINKYWKIYKENFLFLYQEKAVTEYETLIYNKKFRPWNYIVIKMRRILKKFYGA